MAEMPRSRSRLKITAWLIAILALLLASGLSATSQAAAQDAQDAKQILKAMADYVTGQKNISFKYDSTIEVVTRRMQKVQFASSGTVLLSRPDKIHVTRTGGYADVELVFDGTKATLYGKNINTYAQADAAGTIDQLIVGMRENLDVNMPGADLLLTTVYDDLSADVVDAMHVGRGVIEGVECEHLAFRNEDVDWQLWVEVGPNPIPRKYVITTNGVNGGPQYSLVIRDWKTGEQPAADAFAFKPPSGATQAAFAALSDLDEVPPGVAPTTTGAK